MKFWAWLLVMIFLSSCASTPSSSPNARKGERKILSLDDEMKSAENADSSSSANSSKKGASALGDFYAWPAGEAPGLLADESLFFFSKKMLMDVEESDNPLSQAMALCYQKKFKEAYQHLDSLYSSLKRTPSFWNHLGSCYFLEGNKRKALLYYNKALEENAQYAPALNNLGVLYRAQQEDQKALVAFQKAQEASPFSLTPALNIGHLYLEYGLLEKAEKLFRAMLKRSPTQGELLSALGTSLLLKNSFQESVQVFEQVSKENWKLPYVGLNFAHALWLQGNSSKAQEVLREVEIRGDHSLYRYYQFLQKKIE